jgi:hypothetical protein
MGGDEGELGRGPTFPAAMSLICSRHRALLGAKRGKYEAAHRSPAGGAAQRRQPIHADTRTHLMPFRSSIDLVALSEFL